MAGARSSTDAAPSTDRVALGRRGESLAAEFLQRRGHRVLARRFRNRHGEIDLVTASGRHVYFVEVKTRRAGGDFGGGLGAITGHKQRRMARVAGLFLRQDPRLRRAKPVPHLSLVTVDVADGTASLRFLPDAFDAA